MSNSAPFLETVVLFLLLMESAYMSVLGFSGERRGLRTFSAGQRGTVVAGSQNSGTCVRVFTKLAS